MNEWTGLSDAEVETIYAAYDTVAGSEAKSTEGKRRIVEPIYRAVIRARVQTAQMNALRDQVDPRSDEDIEEDLLDNAYRERNAVVAALIRVGGYRTWKMLAPDAEGWWIVYAETPMGQVSWHVAPVDIRLFDGVPVGSDPWDGHTTEEKYDRVARLVPAASSAAAASRGDEGLREDDSTGEADADRVLRERRYECPLCGVAHMPAVHHSADELRAWENSRRAADSQGDEGLREAASEAAQYGSTLASLLTALPGECQQVGDTCVVHNAEWSTRNGADLGHCEWIEARAEIVPEWRSAEHALRAALAAEEERA